MNYLLLNTSLAFIWMMVTGQFTPTNLLVGFIVGYVTLFLAQRVIGKTPYFGKTLQALSFLVFFLRELVIANVRVAIDILSPRLRMQPRVVAYPLDAKTDLEITLIANLISLTPGTLSLDVSDDRRTLYIHVMHAPDADVVRRQIKDGVEQRALALIRSGAANNAAVQESAHEN